MQNPSKRSSLKRFIPGIAWFFLVLFLICLPGSDIPPVEDWLDAIYFDKWVHTGLFAGLTFLFIYPVSKLNLSNSFKKNSAIKIAIAACIWGLTTEFIQRFFIPSRSFDLTDFLADAIGGVIALFFCKKYFLKAA